jgi:hypothetical protein
MGALIRWMDGTFYPDYDRNWDDLNTPGAIRYYAARSGLRVRGIRLIKGRPEYLRLSSFTYLLGWLYERLVNALPGLERFRILLIAVLEKPA